MKLTERSPKTAAHEGGKAVDLAIVVDSQVFREGLAETLIRRGDFRVVSMASSPAALFRAPSKPVDVLLVDVRCPRDSEDLTGILSSFHEATVALNVSDEQQVPELAECGVSGYVTRDASVEDLLDAIAAAARGEMTCSPGVAASLARRVHMLASASRQSSLSDLLTTRELEVVHLIDEGLSNKQIGTRLCIEVSTVKNHVHNILGKLGTKGRLQAAAKIRREQSVSSIRASAGPAVDRKA